MPSFELTGPDGGVYHVDAPDEHAAISAFSAFSGGAQAAPPPDKYQKAAIDEQKSAQDAGLPTNTGYTRRLIHGATFGADSTLAAAALAPLEMIKRGIGPGEAYNYTKAREDQVMDSARKNTGTLGTAAEIAGGGFSGAGLARGGVTFARALAPDAGLLARSAASAGDAGAMGVFSGAMEGNGIQERFNNAMKGGAAGVALGGVVPVAGAVLGGVASPFFSNLRARINPEGYAQSQVARAISDSGQTPAQIGQTVADANAGGSPFTVADAMGNAGQRMLSTVARAPGQGRTDVVNFLENRQAGQGRRVANALSEGFDSPQTAEQTRARLTTARDTTADAQYGQVRNDANPVDVSQAIARIDATLSPGVNQIVSPHSNIAPDSVETALSNIRSRLTDGRSNLTDFTAVQRVRGDLSDAIQKATRAGEGNKARLLGQVLREMDTSMEAASVGHRAANANFAQASRNIEAIDTGRTAALRGRSEDTVPAFRALGPDGQQAFRAGYADPLIEQAQSAATGVNKARPLLNDAFRTEAAAMAPMRTGNLMQNRIAREQTMFETRNHALGNSRTADNLADESAMGVDQHLIGQVVTGNWHGALRSALHAGHNMMTGNTPEVRQQVARILLQQGADPMALNRMVGAAVQRIQFIQNMARNLGRGASGGLAIAGPAHSRQ